MKVKLVTCFRWLLLVGMVAISAAFMLNAAAGDSAIVDESPHIAAGYSYLRFFDYRLNPEQPPLVKALAALPLLFQSANWRINFPLTSLSWQQEINSQWTIGSQFLYESGNDADKIINYARLAPIALTLILIIAVYLFSKELMGRWWAFLPTFLTAFSPTVLAHGHYVTGHIGATLGILLAFWAFLNYLFGPSRKKLLIAGLIFGLAQLTEFSALLLIPYFLILIGVFYAVGVIRDWPTTDPARGRFRRFSIRAYRYLRSVFLIFLIGFGLVFAVYFLLTLKYPIEKQAADTDYILSGLSFPLLKNSVSWLAGIPVLRAAAEYTLGIIMNLQRSAAGNIGNFSYFPLTFLWKESPALLMLVLAAFLFSAWSFIKAIPGVIFRRSPKLLDYLTTNFYEAGMMIFIAIYWVSGGTGYFSAGIKNTALALPFIYILASGAVRKWFSIKNLETTRNLLIKVFIIYREFWSVSAKTAFLSVLVIGYFLSAAITAPYFLSYSNFLSGGTRNGYRLATNSEYDLGQDLKRLAQYIERVNNDADPENDIDRIAVDYFGGGNPKYYLGELVEPWWSARGSPTNEGIKWLAVSISTVLTAKSPVGNSFSGLERKPEDEYQWLPEPYRPYARAGTSIFIYKLSPYLDI